MEADTEAAMPTVGETAISKEVVKKGATDRRVLKPQGSKWRN